MITRHLAASLVTLTITSLTGCVDDPYANLSCPEPYAERHCELHARVNEERAIAGAPLLEFDVSLSDSAQAHTDDMNERGYFNGDSPDGVGFQARARDAGYEALPRHQLLLAGQALPSEVMKIMMGNDNERRILLDPTLEHLGVGHAKLSWVLVLGQSR